LGNLGYKSTNDRKFIGILKSLNFLDADGKPTQRYYEFLDLSQSEKVLAEAIREAYSDLFSINKDAHTLNTDQVKNKLRTLFAGSKKDTVIGYIANTFTALVNYADFDTPSIKPTQNKDEKEVESTQDKKTLKETLPSDQKKLNQTKSRINIDGLQYHINLILPESRDQAVYDALFKSLREHLG
jgi:hypothetical protein